MAPAAILFCVVLAFLVLQQTNPRLAGHPLTFLGFNLAFLGLVMPGPALAFLAAFLAANYLLAAAARRWPAVNPVFFILPSILIFAVLKKYEILPLQPVYAHIPEILGLSYIIFRALTIIFEARDTGNLPGIVSYLNFCLSMFTFLSGPIQRYRAFSEDMERRRNFLLDEKEGAVALTRFMNGVVKIVFIAPFMQDLQNYCLMAQEKVTAIVVRGGTTVIYHGSFESLGDLASCFGFALAALCYLVFLYFNFSGYTDMMIGLGRLLGFRLPENFDNPFAATSFLDFWKRWHISLSFWFRDYCFTPILKRMVKAGIKDPALATLPAYFISFGLLGLWHGRSWPFVLCGLMFAAGSSTNHFYRSVLNRRDKGTPEKMKENHLYQAAASAVTFFYISIAITGLWLSGDAFDKLWRSFSLREMGLSFSLAIACLTAVLYIGRWLLRRERVQNLAVRHVRGFFMEETPFLIAAKAFLFVAWFFAFSANLPDFVYQRF